MTMKKIAIVGAGVAGLTALQTLAEHAHVTVFDKSRGSGGRLASKLLNDSSWDMGAQFIRAHTEEFRLTLAQWESQGWISRWPVTPWRISPNAQAPSPDGVDRFTGTPRMTALSRHLLTKASEFIGSARIVSTHFDGSWHLQDEDGRKYGPFDALVINTPPQQALPLLPEVSPLRDQVAQCEMLPCWTLLLSFDEPLKVPFDAAFVSDSPLAWIARNNSKTGRAAEEAWVLQASHDWSRDHCEHPREQVQQALLQAFADACGTLPPLREQWLHRWLYAIPEQSPALGALADASHNLVITGDWCQHGSVEGAWISGNIAARKLLESLELENRG